MVYLDYAATTPVDPRVLERMQPYFREKYGNPGSIHRHGQTAEAALMEARETTARILNCLPEEIIFTSCGTESDNLALRGGALARRAATGADRILTSRAEHHAVSKTAEQLAEYFGFRVEWLEVDDYGRVNAQTVSQAIDEKTALVSVMYANNEIGTLNPIREIARICRKNKVLFHSDAVQAAAYETVDVESLGLDMMSLGGHKFYGPKGVGALYIRNGTNIIPHLTGGGQEAGLRAGTPNIPYIVGFAEALSLVAAERSQRILHVKPLRDRIIGSVLESVPDASLTGDMEYRLPNHASFVFKDVDGNLLLTLLDATGFACSSGSACKTGSPEPSEVMIAIGLERNWGLGSLRVTLGVDTTAEEVESFLGQLPPLVEKVRKINHS